MYEKIKTITIWIPIIGILLLLMFEKDKKHTLMYDEYFYWGSPILVVISQIWHIISIYFIIFSIF